MLCVLALTYHKKKFKYKMKLIALAIFRSFRGRIISNKLAFRFPLTCDLAGELCGPVLSFSTFRGYSSSPFSVGIFLKISFYSCMIPSFDIQISAFVFANKTCGVCNNTIFVPFVGWFCWGFYFALPKVVEALCLFWMSNSSIIEYWSIKVESISRLYDLC